MQQEIGRFLSDLLTNPISALVVGFILGALAVSGKFSVLGAKLLLSAAWSVSSFGILNADLKDLRLTGSSVLGLAILCLLLSYWIGSNKPAATQSAKHRIDEQTLAELSNFLAQSDELLARVLTAGPEEHAAWEAARIADLKTWYQHAHDTLEKKLSKTDAILFGRLDTSRPTILYRPFYSREHNDKKNEIANYHNNLRAIIERHS